jgi:hypothetical protein
VGLAGVQEATRLVVGVVTQVVVTKLFPALGAMEAVQLAASTAVGPELFGVQVVKV